jgi:hypothetical protein
MGSRRSRRLSGFAAGGIAVVALSMCLTAGCATNQPDRRAPVAPTSEQKTSEQRDQDPQPSSPPARVPDTMDAQNESVDVLARKTESYSRDMSSIIDGRGATQSKGPSGASPGSAPQAPPKHSAVEWLDPSEFRITPGGMADGPRAATDTTDRADRASMKPAISTRSPQEISPEALVDHAAVSDVAARPGSSNPAQPLPPLTSDLLAEKLSRRVKEYPRDVSAQLEYQLLQFLLDQPSPQLAVLSSLPSEDRELVTAVLDGLTNLRNALRADNNMLLSRKIKPLLDLSERLRGQADLTIPTIALCTNVKGFGNYEPIEPARFAAGKEHPAIVYCEIANFASNLNDQQLWETRLTWDMTLYTEQGMSVWSDKTERIIDTSRNRRHDFFVRKMIALPNTLIMGRYLLKVSIVDTQSNRVSEATAPIVIAAQ